jgi:hypothetical protein
MRSEPTLTEIKERWNDVLDELMNHERVLWLAFFDARLVSYANNILTLDYRDATKFSGDHDFKTARRPDQIQRLQQAIHKVLGITPTIAEV